MSQHKIAAQSPELDVGIKHIRGLQKHTMSTFILEIGCNIVLSIKYFLFTSLPNAKGNLQQSANTRDKEDGADEVALCEAVMLQTQALRQD